MNMFILPSEEEKENFKPDFTFLVAGKARYPKWKEEGYKRQWPETVGVPKEVKEKIEKIFSKYF